MGRKPSGEFPPYPKWSNAQFFSFLRSLLRQGWQRWPPKWEALEKNKAKSNNKRYRWRYKCDLCNKYYPKKEIEVDHIVECGQLKQFSDLPGFVSRLFVGVNGLRVVCKSCHKRRKE